MINYLFQGDVLALLGPTLLDFAHHVSGSDNIIPVIFSVRSIGYLTGSIIGGILYDKYRNKRYVMLAASVVIGALGECLQSRGCHSSNRHCTMICDHDQSKQLMNKADFI